MLSLSQIKQWHHSRLLVLCWIAGEDLVDDLLILGGELERDAWVVLWCVSVLHNIQKLVHIFLCSMTTLISSPPNVTRGTYNLKGVASPRRHSSECPLLRSRDALEATDDGP